METLQKTSTCHGQAVIQHPLVSVVMPAYNAEKYICSYREFVNGV